MELEFAGSGTRLVATFNCAAEPGTLKSGRVGWYEVKETPWRLGWHLRSEVSITVTGESYAGDWHSALDLNATVLGGDVVQLTFPIPDFIRPFKKSGWGGADGGPIAIRSVNYHCQARLRAHDPGDGSYLERVGDELRFCGGAKLLCIVKDSLPPPEADPLIKDCLHWHKNP